MCERIVFITEGIKGRIEGRKIKDYLEERYDIICQTGHNMAKSIDAALFIMIVGQVSSVSRKILGTIHSKFRKVPVLFISAQEDPKKRIREKVEVIENGADEYLPGTQTMEEIEASIKALIRRKFFKEQGDVLSVSTDFQIDPDSRETILEGKQINLTKTEFDIVYYLACNANRAVTYRELYEAVWKKEYLCDDTNIMAHIHRIRQKLEKDPKKPVYVQNVYGVGYCFFASDGKEIRQENTIYCD